MVTLELLLNIVVNNLLCVVMLFGQSVRSHLHLWSSGTCLSPQMSLCIFTQTYKGVVPQIGIEANYLCKKNLFRLKATLKQARPQSQLP